MVDPLLYFHNTPKKPIKVRYKSFRCYLRGGQNWEKRKKI